MNVKKYSSSQSAKCCGHSLSGDGDMKHGSSLQEAYRMTGYETKVSTCNSVSPTREISWRVEVLDEWPCYGRWDTKGGTKSALSLCEHSLGVQCREWSSVLWNAMHMLLRDCIPVLFTPRWLLNLQSSCCSFQNHWDYRLVPPHPVLVLEFRSEFNSVIDYTIFYNW